MTKDEARERVARGAALLDQKRPGWAHAIDTGTLDLQSSCLCVIGQVYGNFYSYVGAVTGDASGVGSSRPHAARLGFWVETEHDSRPLDTDTIVDGYRALQDAWIEAIADRLVPTTGDTSLPAAKILSDEPAQVERHRV